MTYNDMMTGDLGHDFALFVGAPCACPEDEPIVQEVVDFFAKYFGDKPYAPEDEDEVIQFCQAVPAGNYGMPWTLEQVHAIWPDWTLDMEREIDAAWAAMEG